MPRISWHPQGRFVEVDGRRAHVVDAGQGPPVLLLHGFLHSSFTWRTTIDALAARHRVIAPDLHGCGWSDRGPGDYTLEGLTRWVQGLLATLDAGPLHAVVGNSLGGALALDLALRAPGQVGRLVLVSPLAARFAVPALPFRLLALPAFEPLFRATAGNAAFVRRALGLVAYRRRAVDAEVLHGFAPLARPGSLLTATAMAAALGAASASIEARLPDLATPALLVWGRHDGVLPLRYGERVARLLPAARLEVFDDCAHCAHEEDPARFHALVDAFLVPDEREVVRRAA
ncbi:MAG: alpha/beta fold hydrolase [Planctomycetes bacterium]|nr:alpha/beta fold hydrolase [Planctomycetota bacterium]